MKGSKPLANQPFKPSNFLDTIKQLFDQLLGRPAIPPLTYRCEPECLDDSGHEQRFDYSRILDDDEPCPIAGCPGVLVLVD